MDQDFSSLQAAFSLLPSGRLNPLRSFGGRWRVQAQPPERCAHLHPPGSAPASSSRSGGDGPSSGIGSPGKPACCLLSLDQEMQPAVPLPPPLGGVLRHLACRQLAGIFEDLQQEAARINAGRPTLWPADGGSGGGGEA